MQLTATLAALAETWRAGVARSGNRASDFRRHGAGTTAIEFALVLPLLLLVWLYLVDFSRAYNERRKMVRLSSAVSELVSEQPTSTQVPVATMSATIAISTIMMTPYSDAHVVTTVSGIKLSPKSSGLCCDATVSWSYTKGGALRPCGIVLQQVDATTPPLPGNIAAGMIDSLSLPVTTSQLIIVDTRDSYQPLFKNFATLFSGGLQKTTYALPRGNGQITLQSASTAAGETEAICP